MDHHLLISADCHAAPKLEDARAYVDPARRADFDAWRARQARAFPRRSDPLFAEEAREEFDEDETVAGGGMDGIWDSTRRLKELDADGVVAEVTFPGGATTPGAPAGALPFDVGIATYRYEQAPALWLAGCRAYNRWLADLCAEVPGRRAGVGLITCDDIGVTVKEVTWLKKNGVFGGILLPGGAIGIKGGPPAYHDPCYERLWSACADLQMPVHTHAGWTPDLGNVPGTVGIFLHEILFWAHRPLWFMLWSGVFERHPSLRLIMTEQKADWLLPTLALADSRYEGIPMFKQLGQLLPLKPSEYYARQCYVGASYMDEGEWEARQELGVERVMWGSDYPHIEGSWPHTVERLGRAFKDIPKEEVARMIGLNAAEVYGFDLDKLLPLAEEHGPPLDSIGC